jgi:zinc/manganese transport system substrate-binding protein
MRPGILIALCACCLAVNAAPATATLRVVATIADLGYLAEEVGGPDVEVDVLCSPQMDPHYLPAKPSLARKLARADLLVYNGLELEIGWLPLLIDKARNPSVRPGSVGELDCSLALENILDVPTAPVDRSQGDIHPLGNPHYTLDPRRMVEVASVMAQRMARLDPDNAAAYRQRAETFAADVARRMPTWLEQAGRAAVHPVLIYRQHWTYLADWTGLQIIGEIEHRPGIAPSPRHVQEMINLGRARGDVILICAQWDHQDAVKEVAERLGCPVAVLPGHSGALPNTEGYFTFIDAICAKLAAAGAEVVAEPSSRE